MFIRAIEDTVETSGVNEKEIVSMLPRCLTSIALDPELKHEMMSSSAAFVAALKDKYPTPTRTQMKEAVVYCYDPVK